MTTQKSRGSIIATVQSIRGPIALVGTLWWTIIGEIRSLAALVKRIWNIVYYRLSPISGVVFLVIGISIGFYGFSHLYPAGWIFENFARDFYANISTELISIAITVVIIDSLNKLRQDKQFKDELIRDMGGSANEFALRAVRELAHHKWLYDGTLKRIKLPRANLQGADLQRADLEKGNLTLANLEKAWLAGSNLAGVSLRRARLRQANLCAATLVGADLSEADLEGANLEGANLSEADLQGANLTRANLEFAYLNGAVVSEKTQIGDKWRLIWMIVNYGAGGLNLTGADLTNACLVSADLSKADLEGADLEAADLSQANLKGANLTGANLKFVFLYKTLIDDKTQIDDKWRLVWKIINHGAGGLDLAQADLSDACLVNADLSKADLRIVDLKGARLIGANLRGVNLREADVTNMDLFRADLEGANLRGASLKGVRLWGANLRRVNLMDVNLEENVLDGGPSREKTDLKWAKYNKNTIWPEGFNPLEAMAVYRNE